MTLTEKLSIAIEKYLDKQIEEAIKDIKQQLDISRDNLRERD